MADKHGKLLNEGGIV